MVKSIGIVVGETSGDILAADLIQQLKKFHVNLKVSGIIGPRLIEIGCKEIVPMDEIAMMGIWEPLKALPRLLKLRKLIIDSFLQDPPDVFIGVDAPEFNLGIELKLKKAGIPTVHYVSPSIWAWREKRIYTIMKAVDLMLVLFPFEKKLYDKYQIACEYVGHPFADQISLTDFTFKSKKKLNCKNNQIYLAILPGSRKSEIFNHIGIYLKTCDLLYQSTHNLNIMVPVVNKIHKEWIKQYIDQVGYQFPIRVIANKTREVISACDIALVTSGTATLEVMLHRKPMIVAYRTNLLTYLIVRLFAKINYIALPNIIAGEIFIPEYIQASVNPVNLKKGLENLINNKEKMASQIKRFTQIHTTLKKKASKSSAEAIIKALGWCTYHDSEEI